MERNPLIRSNETTGGPAPGGTIDEVWRRLILAANDRTDPLRLVTLATVGLDARPSARLMVLRGADPQSRCLWMHTDRHSPKVAELRASRYCCIVAFDPRDNVQLRIGAAATVHERDGVSSDHWSQARMAMEHLVTDGGGGRPSGDGKSPPDVIWPGTAEAIIATLKAGARANFAVIQAEVESVDWMQVVGNATRRTLHLLS